MLNSRRLRPLLRGRLLPGRRVGLRIFRAITCLAAIATAWPAQAATVVMPLLAQAEEEPERQYSLEVFIIALCMLLGLMITLRPSKRKLEVPTQEKEEE